ncbi:hypothetical protein OSB04_032251 [Centaurea solstitialis]|uniref:Reverse transcriptase n=1 Tax=Centaurea solstitialis TaxID=347529 RepID=A0AA38SBZ2_9ASTR|nr:hypothetical protein OSB04_032251 [Centaurea solstitialis]
MDQQNLNMRQRRWLEVIKDYDCEILYHPGKANVVADALSRKGSILLLRVPCMRMTVTTSLIEMIRQSQVEAVREGNQERERIKGQVDQLVADSRGLLTRYGRVWVPVSCEARQTLLEEAHKSKFSIHPGATKMYRDLRTDYWWPGMKRDVARYVEKCLTCLRVKAEHQRPHGRLQPLEIPEWKWEHVTMDLVTGLPRTVRRHDAIWVVVDRLTKSAHFIAIKEASSSEELADIYVREIVARHGVPVTVISDRDVRFTSRFWSRFHDDLGTRLQFSTAFHPQTDGQSERTIRTLEDMLRACVLDFGGSWDSHLPLVEFSYNNSFHASIGMPPYEMLYGRRCRTPVCWGEVGQRELGSTEIVQKTTEGIQLIRDRLRAAQSRQKSYADKRRSDLEFNVGDKVLLKVSPWKGVIRFRKRGKLGPRFIGPFEIVARVGKVAYRLELPPELSQIHNTFHVSQLRKCLADESAHVPIDDIQVDERLNYVEKPVAVLERKTKTLRNKEVGIVKVQWEHRKGSEWTWEPENEMRRDYPELVEGLECHSKKLRVLLPVARVKLPLDDPNFRNVGIWIRKGYETELQTGTSTWGEHTILVKKGIMVSKKQKGKKTVNTDEMDVEHLREIISAEVAQVMQNTLPGLFEQMKDELAKTVNSQVEAAMASRPSGSGSSQTSKVTSYKDFTACQPPFFQGQKDPVASTRWITEIEGAFLTSSCAAEVKVRYASNLLRGPAKDWWNILSQTKGPEQIEAMTWEQFKELFKEQYVPQVEVERLTGEFLGMEQTTESVNEITDKFLEKSLFCRDYVANEPMKMYRYAQILKPEIREFVVMSDCKTFHEMHAKARARELELERQGKRKKMEATQVQTRAQTQAQTQSAKRFKPTVPRVEVKKEFPSCPKCGKHHLGECRYGTGTCYKCGKPGHSSRECKSTAKLCFRCYQPGHFISECPMTSGSTQTTGTAPVKAAETGASKKPELPKSRARVFHLTAEEAKEEPDVVTGTFLVNSLPALVLFDSGASKSFVSLSFCKGFTNVMGRLDKPLKVEIAAEEYRLCSDVYRDVVIELEGVEFRIDLIPIPMREINVVVGVDWLSRNGGHIDCEFERVWGELTILSERRRRPPKLCTLAKARKHVLHGGHSFLAYVVDSQAETRRKTVAEVPVVSEYPDVFPDDLPGIPPERQVEFRIDLVPGAAPVAKAPYRLAPPEMQELSKQLEELLDKGFICWEP